MNDDDLITTLREQRGTVPMNTPLDQIVSRGRAVRARRRIPVAAAALGTAGVAALAAGLALPASHPAPAASRAQLTAWTVTREHGGGIRVTVRELRDPAGLQARLRADGVPASVTFAGQSNPACHGFAGGGTQAQRRQLLRSVATVPVRGHGHVMVIHPSALPSGAGIQLTALFPRGTNPHGFNLALGLVQASQACTGS
jgi:hypothetical protein